MLYSIAFRGPAKIGYHMAPVAVHPDFQRQGVGSALIAASLRTEPFERVPVFVLGDPAFYERFGFVEVVTARCPFDDGNAHFRARKWVEAEEPFSIGYVNAFEDC